MPSFNDVVSRSRGRATTHYLMIGGENFVEVALPEFSDTKVVILATPRGTPAEFAQYLIAIAPGGGSRGNIRPQFEHFLFVVDGELHLNIEKPSIMGPGGFAYLAPGTEFAVASPSGATVLWTKREYTPTFDEVPPPTNLIGNRADVPRSGTTLAGAFETALLPLDEPAYDFAMNILTFEPGVCFDQVELHHQEHGLYMLAGQGVYYLGGDFLEVKVGDYIYMAPYCPQYFYATGSLPSEYLLYKDMHRDGFSVPGRR